MQVLNPKPKYPYDDTHLMTSDSTRARLHRLLNNEPKKDKWMKKIRNLFNRRNVKMIRAILESLLIGNTIIILFDSNNPTGVKDYLLDDREKGYRVYNTKFSDEDVKKIIITHTGVEVYI